MLGFLYVDGLHGFVVMLWIMALVLCPIITVVLWLASLSFFDTILLDGIW